MAGVDGERIDLECDRRPRLPAQASVRAAVHAPAGLEVEPAGLRRMQDDRPPEPRRAGGNTPRAGATRCGGGDGVPTRGPCSSDPDAVSAARVHGRTGGQQQCERDRLIPATPSPCPLARLLDQRLELGDALVESGLVGVGGARRRHDAHGLTFRSMVLVLVAS